MAKQLLNIGFVPNDGTGSNLRAGGTIINANFNEIYTALGDGTNLIIPSFLTKFSDDTSTQATINLGQTLRILGGTGTTSTISGNTLTIDIDNTVATLTGSQALTNKNISGTLNTISSIANGSLTNSTISVRDESSTAISIALGGTLKIRGGAGVTTLVSGGDTVNINLDGEIVTETSSDTLTNKSISGTTNTLTNIANSSLTNSSTKFVDTTSTVATIPLGQTLKILGSNGVTSTISGNTLTIAASAVPNASLANSTVLIGGNTITLGAAATTSISNLSLTGTGVIDSTGQGNKIRFDFANSGALPNATTYGGAFATTTGTSKAFFADSGGWNEIASENSSINLFSDVDLTTSPPTGKQTLSWVSASGKFIPATLGATTLLTGDGSTVAFTITNLYNVNNILVFQNGLCLRPTTDYTVSGTTLTFLAPPPLAAVIMIRYLG